MGKKKEKVTEAVAKAEVGDASANSKSKLQAFSHSFYLHTFDISIIHTFNFSSPHKTFASSYQTTPWHMKNMRKKKFLALFFRGTSTEKWERMSRMPRYERKRTYGERKKNGKIKVFLRLTVNDSAFASLPTARYDYYVRLIIQKSPSSADDHPFLLLDFLSQLFHSFPKKGHFWR